MKEKIYNTIGINYRANRRADQRIVANLRELLNLPTGAVIADIGAGTGNYAQALAGLGFKIMAVEPSEEMRSQATPHRDVEWFSGPAEAIPLPDHSVDGVMVVLALHHFSSLEKAGNEIHRICPKGPIVIYTFDPRQGEEPWFKNYFPEAYQKDFVSFPPIDEIADLIAGPGPWEKSIHRFPLPHDLSDKVMYAGWNKPEIYLDPKFRQNVSGLALSPENIVQKGVDALRIDLESGKWDKQYGHLRQQESFDVGFRFIKCVK
ncbi:MAG: class I SAM-dependent methyltransferase [Thermodesulfobacteriota bacterium]